jgi:hypothetical protein
MIFVKVSETLATKHAGTDSITYVCKSRTYVNRVYTNLG